MNLQIHTSTVSGTGFTPRFDPAKAREAAKRLDSADREGAARAAAKPEPPTGDAKTFFGNGAGRTLKQFSQKVWNTANDVSAIRIAKQISHKVLNTANDFADTLAAGSSSLSARLQKAGDTVSRTLSSVSLATSVLGIITACVKLKRAFGAEQKLKDFNANGAQGPGGIAEAIAQKGVKDIEVRNLVWDGLVAVKSSLILAKDISLKVAHGAGKAASGAAHAAKVLKFPIPFVGLAASITFTVIGWKDRQKEGVKMNALEKAEKGLLDGDIQPSQNEKYDALRSDMKKLKEAAAEIQQQRTKSKTIGFALDSLGSATGIALAVLGVVATAATGGLAAPILALTIAAFALGAGSAGVNLYQLRKDNNHDKAVESTISHLSENRAGPMGNTAADKALVAMNSMLDTALDKTTPETSNRARDALFTAAGADERSVEGQAMRKLFTQLQDATEPNDKSAIRKELLTAMAKRAI